MSTQINVTVGQQSLLDKSNQQAQANRQAFLDRQRQAKTGEEGKRQRDVNRAQQGIGPDGKPLYGQALAGRRPWEEPAAFRQDGQNLNLGHLWIFNKESTTVSNKYTYRGTGSWGAGYPQSTFIGPNNPYRTEKNLQFRRVACGNGSIWDNLTTVDLSQDLGPTSTSVVFAEDTHWSYIAVTMPSGFVYAKTGVTRYTEIHERTAAYIPSFQSQYLYFCLPVGGGKFVFAFLSKAAWSVCKETGYYYTYKNWSFPYGRIDSNITLPNGLVLTPADSGNGGEYLSSAWGPGPDVLIPLKETANKTVDNPSAPYGYDIQPAFAVSNHGYISHEWLTKGDRYVDVYIGTTTSMRKIYSSASGLPAAFKAVLDAAFAAPAKTLFVNPPDWGPTGGYHRGNNYLYPGTVYDINSSNTNWIYSQDDGFNTSPYPGVVFTPSIFKYINDNFYQFTDAANTKTWDQVKTKKRFATQNLSDSSAYGDTPGSWTAQELYDNAKTFKHDLWGVKGQDISAVDPWDAYLPGWTGAKPINKPKFNFTMSEDRQAVPADYDQWSEFVTVWDWDEPGYCRQMCLVLGFTEADLMP